MSVLCCRVPDFLVGLAVRREPELAARPLALLGPDERVWAASPQAHSAGVRIQMAPRRAQAHCPDVVLRSLDLAQAQAEQHAFLDELARWELPVEETSWGAAYVDLHQVATMPKDVRPLAVDAGRRLRGVLGQALQPALGWDSGKFTARAASACAAPGALRLVGMTQERRFLSPLPVSLLPLPEAALQQLHWLGIRTLGQFAELPPAGVWQRWGQAGRLAQQWARGWDDRPVAPGAQGKVTTLSIDVDPPGAQVERVLGLCMDALRPTLERLAGQLAGCKRLRLNLHFLGGAVRTLEVVFVEPAASEARLRAALSHRLHALNWPGEAEAAELAVLDTGELLPGQLTLFADAAADAPPLAELAQRLAARYGPRFFQGKLVEPGHPIPERAARLLPV